MKLLISNFKLYIVVEAFHVCAMEKYTNASIETEHSGVCFTFRYLDYSQLQFRKITSKSCCISASFAYCITSMQQNRKFLIPFYGISDRDQFES